MFLEEAMINGDWQIHIKFRAEIVNLVDGKKKTSSRSRESDNRLSTLFDNGQIVFQL